MIRLLIINWLTVMLMSATAQTPGLPQASSRIQAAYKDKDYLSFKVKYTYTRESSPGEILDSMYGNFKLSHSFYWGILDSTEFMQNKDYAVMIYKPESLINVSEPASVYPQVLNFSALDSLFGTDYDLKFSKSGTDSIITLSFRKADAPYRNLILKYDTTTNLVKEISYTMLEQDAENKIPILSYGGKEYVTVTAIYSDYKTTAFDKEVFNTVRYFELKGTDFEPRGAFKNYSIFISSPNLIKEQ